MNNTIFTLDQAKCVISLSRGFYKSRYNDIFGKKHRLFFEVNGSEKNKSYAELEIGRLLKTIGFKVHDYKKGLAIKEGDKNVYKIGKLRNKLLQKNSANQVEGALEDFRTDPVREGKLYVCLSRHPLDLASASYGREWRSCLNWKDGDYKECLTATISGMLGFIAYATTDPKSLNDPKKVLGRKWVYLTVDHHHGGEYLIPSDTEYGIFSDSCSETLDKVAEELNNKYFLPKLKNSVRYRFNALNGIYIEEAPEEKPVCILNLKQLSPVKFKEDLIKGVNYGSKSENICFGKLSERSIFEAEQFFKYFSDVSNKPSNFFSNLTFCYKQSQKKFFRELYNTYLNDMLHRFQRGVKLERLSPQKEAEIFKDHTQLVNYLRYQDKKIKWPEAEKKLQGYLKDKDKRQYYPEAQALRKLIA